MRINNNLMAMNTHRQLGINNTGTSKSLEKLSSGFRINRAGDDAAGLAISEKMRGQIRGLNMASKNAQDGISLIQTAEGALNETHAILQRMRELAVQSSTDTNTGVDRGELQKEIDQLAEEITRISAQTEFNTQKLLDGNFTGKKFHIGANENQDVKIDIADMSAEALKVDGEAYKLTVKDLEVIGRDGTISIETVSGTSGTAETTAEIKDGKVTVTLATDSSGKITAKNEDVKNALEGLGLTVDYAEGKSGNMTVSGAFSEKTLASGGDTVSGFGINVSTQTEASKSITTINKAIETVSSERSKLGAMQNRLEHTIKNLDTSSENLQAAESRIRDVDMAKEMLEFTKQTILQQAATAMLAQANQMPSTVLQLLR